MFYGHFLLGLKSGHRTAKVGSSLTKHAKVLKTGHRTAKVGSSKPRKKVWLELPRSAVLWPLFPTSVYGRFAQVKRHIFVIPKNSPDFFMFLDQFQFNNGHFYTFSVGYFLPFSSFSSFLFTSTSMS